MRKLIFLLILLIVLLSQSLFSAEANSSVMSVTCRVLPTIEVAFPNLVEFGGVRPYADINESYEISQPQTITIRSNITWMLQMKSDSPHGCMTRWVNNEYTDESLCFPLEWQIVGESIYKEVTGNNVIIVENENATQPSGKSIDIRFRQLITYNDPPLLGSDSYRIQLTFTASHAY